MFTLGIKGIPQKHNLVIVIPILFTKPHCDIPLQHVTFLLATHEAEMLNKTPKNGIAAYSLSGVIEVSIFFLFPAISKTTVVHLSQCSPTLQWY